MSAKKQMKKIRIYSFKPASKLPKDRAQRTGEFLESLASQVRKKQRRDLDVDDVVESARPKTSPIHSFFTWEDTEAAERWRRQEAYALMRAIRVEIKRLDDSSENVLVRAFVSAPHDKEEDQMRDGYRPIEDAMSDPGYRANLITRALGEADSWRRRYEILDELSAVFEAIGEAVAVHGVKKAS